VGGGKTLDSREAFEDVETVVTEDKGTVVVVSVVTLLLVCRCIQMAVSERQERGGRWDWKVNWVGGKCDWKVNWVGGIKPLGGREVLEEVETLPDIVVVVVTGGKDTFEEVVVVTVGLVCWCVEIAGVASASETQLSSLSSSMIAGVSTIVTWD
jgi:hypothetical protein